MTGVVGRRCFTFASMLVGLLAQLALPATAATQILAQSSEFQVNGYTSSDQTGPAVAVDANGAFVVVWEQGDGGGPDNVMARRFTSAGAALGSEFLVNTVTAYRQL